MNRRDALLAGAASLGFFSTRSSAHPEKTPSCRVAHITDVHINGANNAPKGVAAMFTHMFARKEKPELVLNTGDVVMNINGKVTAKSAKEQIDHWTAATKNCPVPIRYCLGNHDIWDATDASDAIPATMKGTALMVKTLRMPAAWYSFDHGGWHFTSLNSMSDWPSYGYLTPEHFDWLKADLKATTKPTVILSHLPILSVTSSVYGDACKKGNANHIPGAWQHSDCFAITELFRRNPHVKLCLSGHMHTQDRCEYRGVWYICGGAASGAWWNGSEYGFLPTYSMINLYADGAFDYEFIDYGWTARDYRGKQLP